MENKAFLQKYAMRFGTYMGIFWIAKFFLFPLGLEMPILQILFLVLTLYVPFLAYKLAKKYRNSICGGEISFVHAWVFITFMYLFSALLTSVGHYIYFRFIDHGYITNTYLLLLQETSKAQVEGWGATVKQLQEGIKLFGTLRPIEVAMQLLSQNVLYGSLLAIPTALILKRERIISSNESECKEKKEENLENQ